MERSITLKIAGVNYPLKAASPEAEELMRLAAESINSMLEKYDSRYPDRSATDKMAFVTLQHTMSKISAQRELAALKTRVRNLEEELDGYLSKIEK